MQEWAPGTRTCGANCPCRASPLVSQASASARLLSCLRPAGRWFRPYPQTPGEPVVNGSALDQQMTPSSETAYVAALLMLYIDLPDTPLRPGPQDPSTARRLYHQGVSLSLAESALLLASLRRLIRSGDLPALPPIRSLAYFQPVIAELQQQPLPAGYLDYLRLKLHQLVDPGHPAGFEKDAPRP